MNADGTVRIVGGGVAGLSLGIALRQAGVETEIFEAGDYPRHRVCGEFVAGLPEGTIEKLGIGSVFAGVGVHRSIGWFWRGRRVARQALPAPAWALSRFALDARLAGLFVGAGGKLNVQTRASPSLDGVGWVNAGGRKADGNSRWLGLKLHLRGVATADGPEMHLGDGGYVGLSTVEDGWSNVCGLFRRRPGLHVDREAALPGYLRACGLDALAERVSAAEVRPGSRSAVAGFAFAGRVAEGGGLRLGDACAMIPPFTGDGMAMAFTGAALAVDSLVAWVRRERSWEEAVRQIDDALGREFRRRLHAARVLHPFLLHRPLQRCFGTAARAGILPLTPLYRLLH